MSLPAPRHEGEVVTPLVLMKYAKELIVGGKALAASVVLDDAIALERARVDSDPYDEEKVMMWWRRAIELYTERMDPDEPS